MEIPGTSIFLAFSIDFIVFSPYDVGVFGNKYLLLELDAFEAEFYHLPKIVPYLAKNQKNLNKDGFSWDDSIEAMKRLIKDEDCEEYKPYKLFMRKWPLYGKLNLASKEKRFEDARKVIDKILSIDLLDPSAYLNLGFCFRSEKQFHKAEQAYKKGLELVDNKTPFLTGLAKTYEELGKFEEAIYLWNQIHKAEKSPESLKRLVELKIYDTNIPIEELKKLKIKEIDDLDLSLGLNFERLMLKEFQKSYNDVDALNKLGVKLVHHKFSKLALKVFDRVYALSKIAGVEVKSDIAKLTS